jgi:hypothetical protein
MDDLIQTIMRGCDCYERFRRTTVYKAFRVKNPLNGFLAGKRPISDNGKKTGRAKVARAEYQTWHTGTTKAPMTPTHIS